MKALWRFVVRVYRDTITFVLGFGVVGIIAYGIDVVVFNVFLLGWLGTGWQSSTLGATVISSVVSTVWSWVGNRYWTFRTHRRSDTFRELAEFAAVSIAGFGIVLLCVWVSHDLLGLQSVLADNISKNVVGFILATAFRFLMYRFWVYGDDRKGRIRRA